MASTLENIIEINHLNKSFGTVKAVNDLSFRVKRGELFAFLGVNGAGKSTTISMICGQLAADGGEIRVNGWDVNRSGKKIKEMTGVVFQDSVLDKPLTARENLKSRAALYGITGKKFEERLQELITIFELQEFINRPVGKLSGGQRRRVDIARALVHRPQLLILDEPTTGLDPQTRKMIWNIIETLRVEEGLTVLLTTHYMEEAASADYIVIIDHGCIAAEGTPYELKSEYVKDYLSIYGVTKKEVESLGLEYEEIRDGYRIAIETPLAATDLIINHTAVFRDYEIVKGGMDDVFLSVTGKKLGGEQ
ncbi:MAG: ABC transporter ATP-binding protein [Lachnospiraceae bacterium]|nr:ABC transporter ATP-binding protein [Lachnospiraceae bacterium]